MFCSYEGEIELCFPSGLFGFELCLISLAVECSKFILIFFLFFLEGISQAVSVSTLFLKFFLKGGDSLRADGEFLLESCMAGVG